MEKSAAITVYEEEDFSAGRHGRLTDAAAQALNKSSDGAGGVLWAGLFNGGDQGAADDRCVGEFTDGGEVFGSRDAEADRDGELCIAAETFYELLGVGFE